MVAADAHSELSQYIARLLLERSDWPLDSLSNPVLRIEAYLEDSPRAGESETVAFRRQPTPVFSHVVDLASLKRRSIRVSKPQPTNAGEVESQSPGDTVTTVLPGRGPTAPEADDDDDDDDDDDGDDESDANSDSQRKGTGGLRPARSDSAIVEETDSQRQIHSGDKFPKRRRVKPEGHFLQPSTLDKLIGGIWEQLHGSVSLDPQSLVEQLQLKGNESSGGAGGLAMAPPMTATLRPLKAKGGRAEVAGPETPDAFSRSNIFCRQVTQASRACRSLEVIVQARWVEHFDAYVDSWAHANPNVPRSRYNKSALMGACADFGWAEKELRNKMYVWRGYKEIKDAGGWAALVFAGMGIYRFCKYRIGFDRESMQRLRNLKPAMEVAADTMHPQWRQLLTVVGESPEKAFLGHQHDWVVQLDGNDPIPLRNTYLHWDPQFSYRQLDEAVVDEAAWGCDDPRWSAPRDDVVRAAALPLCDTCEKEQSDNPKLNNCYCFPTLFGCASSTPSPVLVFRTADGKNNGLLALCAFERGAPIGEFVGLITKGLRDVDVMESSTPTSSYQIWQGRQGNFTRFVNHSCKANAQYQRFSWMNTQRIILVSKGIDAAMEITVDYSEKYWKGLDKKCLCGESCCRYRKGSKGKNS
ncbi:hypothetical protein BKA67DRAFT_553832 [Truncatella angustata]|uniref:SET domain-containing protein n=1 Tax=Truncatella angustata TaxID=152316 RepID=A0A9P9A069_9PEZI|nr:uncharacterized protein BKA67DRAFT_553832 [Truncatella angustata]KAH6656958.1 hypothetical protein BKA67DRAFT_553832 [Truncatella angustata]